MNTLVTTYFIWRNVFVMLLKLSDFVLLNYLATTFFNLATVFPLKVAKWRLRNFFNFEPSRGRWSALKGSGGPGGHAHYKPIGQEDVGSGNEMEPAGILCFFVFLFPPLSIKYRTY